MTSAGGVGPPRTPRAVCTSYLAAFASASTEPVDRVADVIAGHVTDDFVNEHTAAIGRSSAGKEEYRSRLPGFLESMPGLRYEVDEDRDVVAEGGVVFVAYTLRCRVNDRDVAVRGAMRFEVRDGLIARRTDYWDSRVFEQQAGLA